MFPERVLSRLAVALSLMLIGTPVFAASEKLGGVVRDLGSNKAEAGISGVKITVKDAAKGNLFQTISDARGRFTISRPRGRKDTSAHFTKVGYQPRPKIHSLDDLQLQKGAVYLVRERASSNYLRSVARNVVDVSASFDQAEKTEIAELIANLSTENSAVVTSELERMDAKDMIAVIQVATEIVQLTARVRAILIEDPVTKAQQIDVNTFKGTVELSGLVDSNDDKTRAVALARSVAGVVDVQDSIRVKPEG
jgi:osmotically-inducible protein OsmY